MSPYHLSALTMSSRAKCLSKGPTYVHICNGGNMSILSVANHLKLPEYSVP